MRNVGGQIYHSRTASGTEYRSVSVQWSGWSDSGSHYNCGSWSPSAEVIDQGKSFSQNRSCSQKQVRTRHYVANSSTIASSGESRVVTENESRGATGTCAPTVQEIMEPHGPYSAWSPSAGSQTSGYTQSASYTQPITTRTTQCSGAVSETTRNESRTATRSISVTASGPVYGTLYGCGSWLPSAGSQTSGFTQTRNCTRNKTITYIHKHGSTQIHSNNKTVAESITSSRSVSVSWTGWAQNEAPYNCSSWTPDASEIPFGTLFTQRRFCKVDEQRYRDYYVGSSRIYRAVEQQTKNHTDERQAVGECGSANKPYIICNL